MTVVNYMTKTELPTAFNTGNLDASLQQAVINQLIAGGLYDNSNPDDGKSVWIESDIWQGAAQPPPFGSDGNPQAPNFVQALEVESSNVTVQTDSTLKIIVDDGSTSGTNVLNVTGGNNPELIVLGNSNTQVNLNDQGSDTVLAGSGADTLTAGSGHHSLLQGGSGSDVLTDLLSTGTDTLVAGSGPDTITGLQGDQFLTNSTMPASGNDVYNIHDGSGNSTINLGSGNDSVSFFTTAGNDTITNAGGVDTVNYTNSSTDYLTDIKSITPGTGAQSGDYLVKFTDGQSVDLVGHTESGTQLAFTLEFKDGNLNLKGGS